MFDEVQEEGSKVEVVSGVVPHIYGEVDGTGWMSVPGKSCVSAVPRNGKMESAKRMAN